MNEEEGIGKTIQSIPFEKLAVNYEIELIVIDGESYDGTVEIARRHGAKIVVEKNKGYGRAYKTGFSNAGGEIIVTMDADATYPSDKIPEYISLLEKDDIDFITVNRFSDMKKGSMNVLHKLGNRFLSKILKILYSIDIEDSQSGMWIMRKRIVDRIYLKSDGMSFSQEIKIVAFKYFKSLEVGGSYNKRIGKAKLRTINDGFSNLKNLIMFRKCVPDCIKEPNRVTDIKV